ncbi:MAG TPA: AMIN domain-containing protein, partial [Candidatus Hydrogenedentes bacterium]|nr:AMIN domain-containing protein [Candidatus Hydrogenedentota bacterium]
MSRLIPNRVSAVLCCALVAAGTCAAVGHDPIAQEKRALIWTAYRNCGEMHVDPARLDEAARAHALSAIDVQTDPTSACITIHTDGRPVYRTFTVDGDCKVVVDLEDTVNLRSGTKYVPEDLSVVQRVRTSLFSLEPRYVSRVVIDLARPCPFSADQHMDAITVRIAPEHGLAPKPEPPSPADPIALLGHELAQLRRRAPAPTEAPPDNPAALAIDFAAWTEGLARTRNTVAMGVARMSLTANKISEGIHSWVDTAQATFDIAAAVRELDEPTPSDAVDQRLAALATELEAVKAAHVRLMDTTLPVSAAIGEADEAEQGASRPTAPPPARSAQRASASGNLSKDEYTFEFDSKPETTKEPTFDDFKAIVDPNAPRGNAFARPPLDPPPVGPMQTWSGQTYAPAQQPLVQRKPDEDADAVKRGAQWRVNGGPWQGSGVEVKTDPGVHQVEFRDIEGWRPPPKQHIEVVPGQKTKAAARYVEEVGRLRVDIEPPAPDPLEQRVNIDFRDMELSQVIALLAEKAGINIVSGVELYRREGGAMTPQLVTARLNDVPLRQAMEIVLRLNGLGVIKEENNVFRIVTLETIRKMEEAAQETQLASSRTQEGLRSENRTIRIVPIQNADATEIETIIKDLLKTEPYGSLISVTSNSKTNLLILGGPVEQVDELEELVAELDVSQPALPTVTEALKLNYAEPRELIVSLQKGILSDQGSIAADERGRHLIVTDIPVKIEQVRALVEQLDMPVKQVNINAMIVD